MSNTPSKAEIEALVKRHGATSYRNRADTQHPAYGFTEDGLNGLIDEVLAKWGTPAQAAEPVAWLDPWTGTKVTTDYDAYGKHGIPLYTAPQPVAREPLPKFLALKFHARRDKKATVTLLFPGHEAADAWVRGIKGGQHGTE